MGITALAALIAVGAVLFEFGLLRINHPSREAYPIRGLDVSRHQDGIAWDNVPRDRYAFVYIKATEGGDWLDPKFATNWAAAHRRGFLVGAYHFFTLCRSGREQAAHFLRTVPAQPGRLMPALDLELGGNCAARPDRAAVQREIADFMAAIVAAYGQPPLLYTTYEFFDLYLDGSPLAAHRLWVRDIFFAPRGPFKNRWTIWQYANNGRVTGIRTRVDLNAMRGGQGALKALLISQGE